VQVLQHHHHRRLLGAAHQDGPHGVEHLELVQAVAGESAKRLGLPDPGEQAAEAGRGGGHPRQQVGLLGFVDELAQRIDHWEVGEADVAQLDSRTQEDSRPAPAGPVGECEQQAGLAHPGVTGEQHDLRAVLLGPVQDRLEPLRLTRPADER
jgi:hypothetical protein